MGVDRIRLKRGLSIVDAFGRPLSDGGSIPPASTPLTPAHLRTSHHLTGHGSGIFPFFKDHLAVDDD